MRERSVEEILIFGCDEPIAPSTPMPTALPMDDATYDYIPAGSAADASCRQLADDAFAAEICGLEPQEFRKAVARPAPVVPRSLDQIARDSVADIEIDFDGMVKRASSALEKSSEHRRAVQQIVDNMRRRLRKYGSDSVVFDPAFARLAASMTGFVQQAIITD